VTRDDQLQWEARWAVPAGFAAFGAGLLTLITVPLFVPEDRKGIKATADFLLTVDDKPGQFVASTVVSALAALLLIGVFLYLFRAVTARSGGIPQWFVYLVIAAPAAYAVSRVAYAIDTVDIANDFASGAPIRGEAGNQRATDLLTIGPVLGGLQIAGTVGVAFLFVMLSLRARRVGLVTPFMGILGAICGGLIVLPLAGISFIVQGFWLAALGAVFIGRWPGGRGPAWETGEAVPWPSARQRMAEAAGGPAADPDRPPQEAPAAPDPEPVPDRPPSRKRRKKKR
jgi:hypothetical protein